MSLDAILAAIVLAVSAAPGGAPLPEPHAKAPAEGTPIIVKPPPTPAERRRVLRAFTKEILRPPRMNHPVAKFFYPICPEVLGLEPPDAAAIAERIRDNARMLGVGANPDAGCTPTIKVAFMSDKAGPAERWLNAESPLLAHLAIYERARVLGETGPVRAWNRMVVRDFYGRPQVIGETVFIDPPPKSATDPIVTTEITGAAVMIARAAAEGFTLAQLADYATIRTLIGSNAPAGDAPVPVRTILSLFADPDPPRAMTEYDRALVAELYNAPRNSSARRVLNDIVNLAARAQIAAQADN